MEAALRGKKKKVRVVRRLERDRCAVQVRGITYAAGGARHVSAWGIRNTCSVRGNASQAEGWRKGGDVKLTRMCEGGARKCKGKKNCSRKMNVPREGWKEEGF